MIYHLWKKKKVFFDFMIYQFSPNTANNRGIFLLSDTENIAT